MAKEGGLPDDAPTVYRGGASVKVKPHEIKLDKTTGLLKTTHGLSVDADPHEVGRFGGAFQVLSIPAGLNIIQRGRRESHYELVPAYPMTLEQYQALLDEIKLQPVKEVESEE